MTMRLKRLEVASRSSPKVAEVSKVAVRTENSCSAVKGRGGTMEIQGLSIELVVRFSGGEVWATSHCRLFGLGVTDSEQVVIQARWIYGYGTLG